MGQMKLQTMWKQKTGENENSMNKLGTKVWWVLLGALLLISAGKSPQNTPVLTGLDRVEEYASLFQNKRVGIITNHTAFTADGRYITDVIGRLPGVKITALFGPEHGIKGSAEAGAKVESEVDPIKGVPIYSLYGKTRKPTPEMLREVDVLVFDIQDVGARYYTYIYTMALAMEAAAEQHIPFVVLDRPNPITGVAVEGNVLDTAYASFVGMFPIPMRHGMTVGELARLFNDQGWLKNGVRAQLTVIPLKGWKRPMWYDQTGLRFIKPSPNMPDVETATLYPGLCLIEGTNVSEGRGTYLPFKLVGAPWMDGRQLAAAMAALNLPGVTFTDTSFTPVRIPGMAENPKYKDQQCQGIRIRVTNREQFKPVLTGVLLLSELHRLYPGQFRFRKRAIDRLAGTDELRQVIQRNGDVRRLYRQWEEQLQHFLPLREKYLLYPAEDWQ